MNTEVALAMARAYLRLDPGFDEHKEAYPDGPYAALIATFCAAETQPQRGRFRNLEYLRRLLGRRGRFVAYLLAAGDIVELPDGRVYVDGWDEWQEGDWKVAERVSRIRNRIRRNGSGNGGCNGQGNGGANGDVTADRKTVSGKHSEAVSGGVAADRASAEDDGLAPPTEEELEELRELVANAKDPALRRSFQRTLERKEAERVH